MKKLNNKGFTLVELLAVIVVLALLMVVAASSIGSALDNSKIGALETEAKKLLTNINAESQSLLIVNKLNDDTEIKKQYNGEDGDFTYDVTIEKDDGLVKSLKVCYGSTYYVESTDGKTFGEVKKADGKCTKTVTVS